MNVVSRMISFLFDLILLPFGRANHTLGLVALSILTGVAMAFVFKWVSDPRAIRKAKDKLKARILEMRIYQDDPALILRAFGGTLRSNVAYMGTLIKPFLILIVPIVIVFIQMDERYGRSHLPVDSKTILSVQLKEGLDPFSTPVGLALGDGLVRDANPVRVMETREIDWRLRVVEPGTYSATLSSGGSSYVVPVVAEPSHRMIGHTRKASFMEAVLHPSLPPIPGDSPFYRVSLKYPGASYPLFSMGVHWIVIFVVYSFVAALALKFIIKFEI